MLLAIAPLVGLALIATGALAVTFLASRSRRPSIGGTPDVVDIYFLPENSDWVIKVYQTHSFYEAHIYYAGHYEKKLTGYSTADQAMGAGVSWARLYTE